MTAAVVLLGHAPGAPARADTPSADAEATVPPVTAPPEAFFAKYAERDRDVARDQRRIAAP